MNEASKSQAATAEHAGRLSAAPVAAPAGFRVLDDVEAAVAGVLDVEVERWLNETLADSFATAGLEETIGFGLDEADAVPPDPNGLPSVEDTVDALIAQAASAAADAASATAVQMAAMADTIEVACRDRALFLGAADTDRAEATWFARRAAVAELAVSLHVTENTVSALVAATKLLRAQLPNTWAALQNGTISHVKASIIADHAASLVGQVSAQSMAAFDTGLLAAAGRLTPTKLRQKARSLREKLHPQPAVDRHAKAMQRRSVCVEADLDGMAWFTAHLPAEIAHGAYERIDAAARNLRGLPGEERTLEQLRADAAGDILTGTGTPNEVRAVINVTVPVMTLIHEDRQQGADAAIRCPAGTTFTGTTGGTTLGDTPGDTGRATPLLNLTPAGAAPRVDPAILEGYGPIDEDTARRLTGGATTLYRLLVDPIDGATITVDRTKYRPPADLKRLVKARFATCSFPGCNRPAERCDLDHTQPFNTGGDTSEANIAPLCRHHHGVKHKTGWVMKRTPNASIQWTSPRGITHDTDPPPF